MRRFAGMVFIALVVPCTGACTTSSHTPSVVPSVASANTTLRIGDAADARVINVETAVTAEQSERGLGYRDTLAADAGMLFDLQETRVPTFWMKGMRFALDMVWIGEDKRVAELTSDVRPQPGAPDQELRRYSPAASVHYVLELNSGAAARLGVTPGVQLSFSLP